MQSRIRRGCAAASFLGLVVAGAARADSEVTGRLQLLSRSLAADYQVKRPAAAKATLAVFDFACPETLAKQRVGYAVAQLLTAQLVGATQFTVVERAELERMFKEQALGQTGAVDQNSAVQLGKLAGAGLAVFGNVDKLGPAYQVSARLADVATGEVLAVAVQELPAKAFETEAQPYLNLVPETEAVGVFLGVGDGLGQIFTNHGAVSLSGGGSETVTALTGKPDAAFLTFGVRYYAAPWLMFQAMYEPIAYDIHIRTNLTVQNPVPSQGDSTSQQADFLASGADVTALWARPVSRTVRVFAGAGVGIMAFNSGTQNGGNGLNASTTTGNVNVMTIIEGNDTDFIRPHLNLAAEWRLQARLGWTVAMIYAPLVRGPDMNAVQAQGATDTDRGALASIRLAPLAIHTTLALYF